MGKRLGNLVEFAKGCFLNLSEIVAVLDGEKAIGKRARDAASKDGLLISPGPKRAGVILTKSGYVFGSEYSAESIAKTIDGMMEDKRNAT